MELKEILAGLEGLKAKGSLDIDVPKIENDSRNIATFLNNIKESFLVAIGNIGILFYVTYLNPIIGIFYFIATLMLIYIHYYGIKKSIYYKTKSFEINEPLGHNVPHREK